MKKNLKKVISAVLALTLAMSSFVAMTTSAATFADVADTASYAEAVNALAALGAIAGTGDGTFKPEDNITRAEAATMVVAALNLSADAQNAGATSKFTDVNEQAKWAVGYVNVGVAQNYISGTSATTFNPLDNVTYAQMLTMLTRILGYGDFAVSRGGYPDGYVTSASIAGIVKGVAAGTEEPITRAQAAQLIWNAVQAPMLDIETFTGSIADTQLKKQDGTNGKWKTVLSDKFDAYVLDVTVENTSIKDEDLDAGTITMKLDDIDQWDPSKKTLNTKAEDLEKVKVAVGNTDAEDYIFSSAKVIAEYNTRGEWKLIYFAPTSKVVTKAVDGTLINKQEGDKYGVEVTPDGSDEGDEVDGLKLHIKKSEGSNPKNADDYELTPGAKLYVNGFEYMAIADNATTARKLIANSVGETVLVQKADSAKKIYDKVMIDVYALAKVSQVKADDEKTTVKLSSKPIIGGTTWGDALTIEVTADQVEDGDKIVTVTKAGAAASLAALAKNDIVAIKYNLAKELDATDCKYIDIIASNDTATGVFTARDTDTNVYTVGGVNYDVSGSGVTMTRGETYTMYLDPFGDIFAVDKVATSINYAIVESYVAKAASEAEYGYLEVVTLDGQVKRLYVESDDEDDILDVLTGTNDWTDKLAETTPDSNKYKAGSIAIADRVISYKVKTSTGRVTSIAHVATTATGTDVTYKASTNRLGTLTLSDTAVVLDATKYEEGESDTYKASALSALVEDSDYTGFVLHQNDTDKKWAYVVVLDAGTIYSSNSDFAVATNKLFDTDNATVVDDETVIKISVAGSDTPLYVAEDADVFVNTGSSIEKKTLTQVEANTWLDEGAVFFYTTDADGLVDRIDVVVNGGYKAGIADLSTAEFNATIKLPATSGVNKAILASDWKVDMSFTSGEKYSRIQLFYAPVVTASDRNVSFAALVEDGSAKKFNSNATVDFGIAEDANIYAYDVEDEGVDAFSAGAFYAINVAETDADGYAWVNKADKYNYAGEVCYALVMAVDDVITNAVVFENVD